MNIGIIGTGNMGGAIYHAIKSKFKVTGFDPYPAQGITYEADWDIFIKNSEIVILAVKPDKITEVVSKINKPANLISIAAGIKLETIQSKAFPGSKVVRVMPNLPLMVGEGCSAYCGNSELLEITKDIFSCCGIAIHIPEEKLMDAVTGLSGSGPAYVFSFIQAMAEGGVKSGLTYKDALKMSIQTVKGSVELLEKELLSKPDTHPTAMRNKVTSPGGTTIYGLNELEKNHFNYAVMEAIFQATKRGEELGKK